MSLNNDTLAGEPAGNRAPNGSNPPAPALDIVWSSPVSTGTGCRLRMQAPAAAHEHPVAEELSSWPSRHVVAFESDLLDNAFMHWEHERPTLEMIAGYKKDVTEEEYRHPVESLMSGAATLVDGNEPAITPVPCGGETLADGVRPFQPDTSAGIAGPAAVRKDGIEDPLTGWRPTGLVFFETLSTPPRGTVYSSRMLSAFGKNSELDQPSPHTDGPATEDHDDQLITAAADQPAPFFDFPEDVGAAPPEDTEDFPLQSVVVTGGGGGAGGTLLVRMFGRVVLLGLAFVGVSLFAIIGMYAWYAKQRIYDGNTGGRSVVVTVTPGQSFRSIIDGMHKDGILKGFIGLDDRYLMRYLAYFYEDSDKIKPGVYRFSAGQDLNQVYRRLIEGSKDYKITIPEGKTAIEVGQQVAKQYKGFDATYFNQLIHDPEFIKSVNVQAPSLEGYLYPSTYYFGPGMKEEELIKLMVNTFYSKLEAAQDKITTDGLSLHEHVIMASLIEREARMDEDRPLIASVIYNRMEKGMPLQIDATVNFALNDWRRLRNSDYQVEHPYNTYKFKGLPPGPITSPRIESLVATFTAPETSYLYYVHKGDGHHAFAETYPQHQANVGRYIREKSAATMGNTRGAADLLAAGSAASTSNAIVPEPAQSEEIQVYIDSTEKSPAIAGEPAQSAEALQRPNEPESPGTTETEIPEITETPEEKPEQPAPTPAEPEQPAPTPAEPEQPAPTPAEPEQPAPGEKTPAPKSY